MENFADEFNYLAKQYGITFFEASAKSSTNVDLSFQTIAKTIMEKMNVGNTRDKEKGIKLKELKPEQSKENNNQGGGGCC